MPDDDATCANESCKHTHFDHVGWKRGTAYENNHAGCRIIGCYCGAFEITAAQLSGLGVVWNAAVEKAWKDMQDDLNKFLNNAPPVALPPRPGRIVFRRYDPLKDPLKK